MMSSQLLVEKVEKVTPAVPTPPLQTAGPAAAKAVVLQRPLFSQSFVELSGDDAKRRRMTTGTTFLVQAAIMTVLVILPLVMVDALPTAQLASFLTAPPPPPPPPPPPAPALKPVKVVTEVMNGQLLTPSRIPKAIKMIKEEENLSAGSGVVGGVEGGVPGGSVGGVLGSLIPATKTAAVPVAAMPKRLRVSTGVSEGLLIQRVEPVYPVIAKRARIEGTVQLSAVISTEGTIENLRLVSGHPLLVPAAMDAVKQWRYRPYILNGGPLEVETTVYVIFHMTN